MNTGIAMGLIAAAVLAGGIARAESIPTRTPLEVITISPAKPVSRVVTTRVDFAPGQTMPRHKHTVPVICFVTKGEFLAKIGSEPERRVGLGEVTYEPPGVVVVYFRNGSTTAAAQLECSSLAGDEDKTLNVMLPE